MPAGGTTTLRSREAAILQLIEWGGAFDPSMTNDEIESELYDCQPSEDCQCNFSIKELPPSGAKILDDRDGYICGICRKLLAPRQECDCINPDWKPVRIVTYEGDSMDHTNQNRNAV